MMTREQLQSAADIIGCNVAAVQAVYSVESNGKPFLNDGRVRILFEGHRFWKNILKAGVNPRKFSKENPKFDNVLHEFWQKSGKYMGGSAEWDVRMNMAFTVCDLLGVGREIALQSASYGAFQILGENFKAAGYVSALQMSTLYQDGGEVEQLRSFIRFLKATGLDDELRDLNWDAFARGYNGTRYKENQYHLRLAFAYKKFNV